MTHRGCLQAAAVWLILFGQLHLHFSGALNSQRTLCAAAVLLLYFGQLAWQVQVLHPQGYYRVLDSNNGSPARFQLTQRASTEDEGTVIVGGPGQPFRWILPVDTTGTATSLTYSSAAGAKLAQAACT